MTPRLLVWSAIYVSLLGTGVLLVVSLGRHQPSIGMAQTKTDSVLQASKPFDLTPRLDQADQRWPAVAAGKGVYLVVWQEGEAMAGPRDTNIFAVRVRADGAPLDSQPIAVCTAKHHQAYPSVCYDGTNFVVAWQDFRSGKDWDIYAARITPEGKVLDPDGVGVALAAGNQIYPALACNDSETLLVWSDLRPAQGVPEAYGLRGVVLQNGQAPQGQERELVAAYDVKTKQLRSYLTPQVCWDGVTFVIAAQHAPAGWQYAGPSLFRVSEDMKVEPIRGGFLGESCSLAGNPSGKNFLVWSCRQLEHGHGAVAYLASLFTSGREQINHMAVGLQDKFGPRNGLWCAVTFNGKNYLAVVEQTTNHGYSDQPGGVHSPLLNVDLVATRVASSSGELLDTGCLAVPAHAWQDMRPFRQKALTLKGASGIRVACDPEVSERHPAMASLGDGQALMVYSHRGSIGKFKIFGVLLSE